jgi:hypothetical protein
MSPLLLHLLPMQQSLPPLLQPTTTTPQQQSLAVVSGNAHFYADEKNRRVAAAAAAASATAAAGTATDEKLPNRMLSVAAVITCTSCNQRLLTRRGKGGREGGGCRTGKTCRAPRATLKAARSQQASQPAAEKKTREHHSLTSTLDGALSLPLSL